MIKYNNMYIKLYEINKDMHICVFETLHKKLVSNIPIKQIVKT